MRRARQARIRVGRVSPCDDLLDSQLEQFQEAFNIFDLDRGGTIDASTTAQEPRARAAAHDMG